MAIIRLKKRKGFLRAFSLRRASNLPRPKSEFLRRSQGSTRTQTSRRSASFALPCTTGKLANSRMRARFLMPFSKPISQNQTAGLKIINRSRRNTMATAISSRPSRRLFQPRSTQRRRRRSSRKSEARANPSRPADGGPLAWRQSNGSSSPRARIPKSFETCCPRHESHASSCGTGRHDG